MAALRKDRRSAAVDLTSTSASTPVESRSSDRTATVSARFGPAPSPSLVRKGDCSAGCRCYRSDDRATCLVRRAHRVAVGVFVELPAPGSLVEPGRECAADAAAWVLDVAGGARDDVEVDVGGGLAGGGAVVHAEGERVRPVVAFELDGDVSNEGEQVVVFLFGQFGEPADVASWDDDGVSGRVGVAFRQRDRVRATGERFGVGLRGGAGCRNGMSARSSGSLL